MLNLVRPKYFVPVHGEYRHLVYHSKLAEKLGIPLKNIFILEDGDILRIDAGAAEITGKVQSGRLFIDGKSTGDVEGMVLRDRWRLAHDGIIIVLLTIEKLSAKIISGPDIISRGFFSGPDSEQQTSDILKNLIAEEITGLDAEVIRDLPLFQEKLRRTVKKYLKQEFDQRPMIMPIIMEV